MQKELESERRGETSVSEESSDFIEKMKIEWNYENHNGKNEKKKLNYRNSRCEEKKHAKKLKCNKQKEEEVNE